MKTWTAENLQTLILSQHQSTSSEAIEALNAFADLLERIKSVESAVPVDDWDYQNRGPKDGGDQRCLCTIQQDGMVYVGVAIWTVSARFNSGAVAAGAWFQNGNPLVGKVVAWRPLPEPARKRWVSGVLV